MKSFVCVAICLLALTSTVMARPHSHHHKKHQVNTTGSVPSFFADPRPAIDSSNIDGAWDKINARLAANNYKMNVSELASANGGVYGVDLSSWAGESTFSCLVSNGYSFAIVRAYQSSCQVDPNGVHTVANAWAAGVSHVDIYLFPSFGCGDSASTQVANAINNMGSIPFGTLWFDIETSGSGWSSDPDANHSWLTEGINQAASMIGSSRIGIYSSSYAWNSVMGGATDMGQYPMWYAHYDNNPSFSDWSSFGGWSSPAIKQYEGDATICSFDVDVNWYPA